MLEPIPLLRTAPTAKAAEAGLITVSLCKSFKNRQVLIDLSLSVRPGEVVGLLGRDGAGKTTCFQLILGLLRPNAGRILLNGIDITNLPTYRRARLGLGYLPQEACIFRGLTVEENIRSMLELAEPVQSEREARLERLLGEFHLDHPRSRAATQLSGGERRRCEIVRALAASPSIILLDEPFAGIDPLTISEIEHLIRDLSAKGVGVLITDYNVHEMLGLVDRAYVIDEGKLLFDGSPSDLSRDEKVRHNFLGEAA